jgi:beta-lactam-binding protein with PASTA domain
MISLEINGEASIAYCEANGLSKCFMAYADNASGETIESIGFNPNSGYVYIALENGVQIVSSMGQDVEFLTTRVEDGCELFYNSYEEALNSSYLEEEEEEDY